MNTMTKRAVSVMLSLLVCAVGGSACLLSCGGSSDGGSTTNENSTEAVTTADTEAVTESLYTYPEVDYGGSAFRFLNAEDIYSMRAQIDREGLTGESLDDVMYERCREVERRVNVVLEETCRGVDTELIAEAYKILMAGEDAYDAIYVPTRDMGRLTAENALYNLYDFEELHLDSPWWIQTYNDAIALGDSLYGAAGYSQLMVMDSLWCLYFNEDMMTNLDLDKPYDLVRQGTWTIDRFAEYMKAAANLNGDSDFLYREGGSCIWVVSMCDLSQFLYGFGAAILRNQDGVLTPAYNEPLFINGFEKLITEMSVPSGYVFPKNDAASDDTPGSYINIFEVERAMFVPAELSKTARLRDKDFSFGVVPFPKYDETQERYYAIPFYGTPVYTIPVTVKDAVRSAVIGDVMTYISYEKVLPVFREDTLEQKGLRNEDSIEMLDLIIRSSTPNLLFVHNIGSELQTAVNAALKKGETSIASAIAKYEPKMQKAIDAVNAQNQK